jgi:hypothetical protein
VPKGCFANQVFRVESRKWNWQVTGASKTEDVVEKVPD